jgi:hypothetical protein
VNGRFTMMVITLFITIPAYAETEQLSIAAPEKSQISTGENAIEPIVIAEKSVTEEDAAEETRIEESIVEEPNTEVPIAEELLVSEAAVEDASKDTHEEGVLETVGVKEEPDVNLIQFIQLVEATDFNEAYLLGLDLQTEWEGDEEFDFNFGLAAAQTGHYNQAIFSFERLLQAYPNNLRFRLELARCHYFLKNYNAAEREFKQVESRQPPENVQQQIDKFLTSIAEQKQQITRSWVLGAGIAGGYDSNINAATDLDAVDATLFISNAKLEGSLNLDDEQQSQGSGYYQLQGFAQYQQPLSKRTSIDATAFASNKNNFLNDTYDLTHTTLDAGFRILRGNHNFRFGGAYRHFWLGSETLQYQALANARWQWQFAPGWNFSEDLEIGKQDNDQNNSLDYHQWQSKSTLQRDVLDLNQSIQLSLGSDSSIRKTNQFQGRDYYSLIYQVQQGLTEKQRLFGLINYRINDYLDEFANDHIFYADKKRSDQLSQIIAGWTYMFMENTSTKVQLSHSKNTSNLELYEYQRTLIEVGLMISFN